MSQMNEMSFTTPVELDPAVTETRVFVPQHIKDGKAIWRQRCALTPNADPQLMFASSTSGTGLRRAEATLTLYDYETQTLQTLGNKVPYLTVQVKVSAGGDVRELVRFRGKHLVHQMLYNATFANMLFGLDDPM